MLQQAYKYIVQHLIYFVKVNHFHKLHNQLIYSCNQTIYLTLSELFTD